MKTLYCLLTLCLAIGSLRADDAALLRTVSTSGDAIVYAAPDLAIVSFGIETFHPQLTQAIADNRRWATTLVDAIEKLGIEPKFIHTELLQVQIEYAYQNGRLAQVEGYRARRTYTVRLSDISLIEKLVEAGLSSGANQLQGIEFQSTQLAQHRAEARTLAVRNARDKATLLATQLGAQLGKPRQISENSGVAYPMMARAGMAQKMEMSDAAAAPVGETIPLGQIAIRADVNVTFDLL